MTEAFTGFFWAVRNGDPALEIGVDNGSFPTLDWLYVDPNYPVTVLTTWAADTRIDGCIDSTAPRRQRCQATFLQDVDTNTGGGLFVLFSSPDTVDTVDYRIGPNPDTPTSGFFYIEMAPMPPVQVTSMTLLPPGCGGSTPCTELELMLEGPDLIDLAPGSHLSEQSACASDGGHPLFNGLIQGWKLYVIEAWTATQTGVHEVGSTVGPFLIECREDVDTYFAWQMVLDSGFESPYLSTRSGRVECVSTLADPDNVREAPAGRQAPRIRQR